MATSRNLCFEMLVLELNVYIFVLTCVILPVCDKLNIFGFGLLVRQTDFKKLKLKSEIKFYKSWNLIGLDKMTLV